MTSTQLRSDVAKDRDAKPYLEQIESASIGEVLNKPTMEKVDRFGAHEKTNPKELALVKKLDRYILVCRSNFGFARESC
jgi:hypothetical protein